MRNAVFVSLLHWCSICFAEEQLKSDIDVEAERVTLDPSLDRLVATGRVRLRTGDLEIKASLLTLNLKTETMYLQQPVFSGFGNMFFVSAPSGVCSRGSCVVESPRLSLCPHPPHECEIKAKRMIVHPKGDVDLVAPVLKINETPIFALPWIRLRRPGTSGLLPPRMGYSKNGGLIIGPAGYLPLGEYADLSGYFAIRTKSGAEAETAFSTLHTKTTVIHIVESKTNSARVKNKAAVPLENAFFSSDVDLVTNRRIIDETAIDPLDRAVSHTVSRALVSTAGDFLLAQTYFDLINPLTQAGYLNAEPIVPRASLEIQLPAIPIASIIWPEMGFKLVRRGFAGKSMTGSDGNFALAHSLLDLRYGVGLADLVGPFAINAEAALRHRGWIEDRTSSGGHWTHLACFGVDISLPLIKRYKSVSHYIEPFIRYRLTPWQKGAGPKWIIDSEDRLRKGQGLDAGFSTELFRTGRQITKIELFERLDLAGFKAQPGPAYIAGNASFGSDKLFIRLDGALDHSLNTLSLAGVSLESRAELLNSMTLGARWIGPGLGPHLDQPFGIASGPWLVSRWLPFETGKAEVFENFGISLTKRISAELGIRMGVYPKAALNVVQYGLKLRPLCGCFILGLTASHRPSSPVPDIMLVLNLGD